MIAQLGAPDLARRQAAADGLVAAGTPAVGPLVALLHRPVNGLTPVYIEVLQRIGDPAFWPLVDALQDYDAPRGYEGAPSRAIGIGRALVDLQVSSPDMFVPLLRHRNRDIRSWACEAFAAMGRGAAPYVPAMLPLLADADPNVRYSACKVVGRLTHGSSPHLPALLALLTDPDDDVRREAGIAQRTIDSDPVSMLRAMRRGAGPHRRRALDGLAEAVGWAGLDPADQALIRRLMRTKIPHEVPQPFEPNSTWYAVPTRDQTAVLDALGLSDPTPVTMRYGEAAASGGHLMCGTVAYVTPVLDGWTLAFMWEPEYEERAADLSHRFGTAHFYISCAESQQDGEGWCIAENGTVVRSYLHSEGYDELDVGAPHPAERGYALPHEDVDDDQTCDAMTVAARLSVNPAALGPRTRVEGQPVMALTADGRQHGIEPGTLPFLHEAGR